MADKIKLDGTLIPVGREIRAKPGQFLIVAAGVCVGVYTGDAAIPVAPKTIEHEAPVKKARKAESPHHNAGFRKHGSGSLVDGSPVRTIIPIIEKVREYFKTHTEASVRDLRTAIGEEHIGQKAWRLRDALAWMSNNGELRPTGASTNRVYHKADKRAA